MNPLQHARDVLTIEADAIARLADRLDEQFEHAVRCVIEGRGKVIVSGMGKSGLIGKKIAATLASTGTPSFFMHPGEAYHGDLGMVDPHDVVLAISYSGETDEILRLIPFWKDNGNVLIALTGNPRSTLARYANYHLNGAVAIEACPFNLTPTSSTTAALALGDALAVAIMKEKDFRPENFARFHPGGSLGKRLVTRVEEVMQRDALPLVQPHTNVKEIIHRISNHRLGLAIVLDDRQQVAGIITDGDIRRAMETNEQAFFTLTAADFPTKAPKTVSPAAKLAEAERLMNHHKINTLLVMEGPTLRGVVQIYDIV
jgi:arabinose-5-phosphate isomerase